MSFMGMIKSNNHMNICAKDIRHNTFPSSIGVKPSSQAQLATVLTPGSTLNIATPIPTRRNMPISLASSPNATNADSAFS